MLEETIDYAMRHLGVPYHWGGNNRLVGFDCSGFVCEVLKSVGLLQIRDDLSSQQLYEKFLTGSPIPSRGSLAFFGKGLLEISHVALVLDSRRMIECAGGDHTTLLLADAQAKGALVRVRPVLSRGDFLGCRRPPYQFPRDPVEHLDVA